MSAARTWKMLGAGFAGVIATVGVATAATEEARARGFGPDRDVVYVDVHRETVLVPMTRAERARFERDRRDRMEERERDRGAYYVEYEDGERAPAKLLPPGNGGARGPGTSSGARSR